MNCKDNSLLIEEKGGMGKEQKEFWELSSPRWEKILRETRPQNTEL